ncbi:monocarboxylate transporter 12-like protein [Dinothrombium tinctorium]|uniref:Monocarboxylate transporter 12-like protein n=1 Tax=Dinothrombium tinctorium TaxID=1965070 RepID=A0A443RRZ7_9ACAR|nr:monocarboxylate transporter 12-like protein [Dinothrombium tinctorium]
MRFAALTLLNVFLYFFEDTRTHRRASDSVLNTSSQWNALTSPGNGGIPGINMTLSPDDPTIRTIRQHYYPEGGWGWVITFCVSLAYSLTSGLSPASGFIIVDMYNAFKPEEGIVVAVSYGIIVGIGVSMIRDTAVIMIGQYFKRKREFVEIFVISGSGLGIALMPLFLSHCIRSKNWRFGFQSLALVVFLNFFLAVLYRPASLYHPQRRAILHLKSLQKRSRLKEHHKQHAKTQKKTSSTTSVGANVEKSPYFDFSVLKSKTIQILLCGTCISNFGITAPLFLMAYLGEKEDISNSSMLSLQAFYGISVILGTAAFGFIVVKNSVECMIARQYLCQASSLMISASLLAFTTLGDYSGYLLFVVIHGFFFGGYQYSLKMFVYEKVRSRNFDRAWSFVQCVQSVPILVGVPITGFLNEHYGDRSGFYLSSFCTALGSFVMFFIDAHKKNIAKKRKLSSPENSALGGHDISNQLSRLSSHDSRIFINSLSGNMRTMRRTSADSIADASLQFTRTAPATIVPIRNHPYAFGRSNSVFSSTFGGPLNAELTCISEEVIMENFMDNFVGEEEATSCDREAKYLMLSEFENNMDNSVVPQEAAALVKSRKEKLKDKVKNEPVTHNPNCPFRHPTSMVNSPTNSRMEQKSSLSSNRRASFAGFSSFVNDDCTMFSKSSRPTNINPNVSHETSFIIEENVVGQCPNCLRLVDCETKILEPEPLEVFSSEDCALRSDEKKTVDSIEDELKIETCCSAQENHENNENNFVEVYTN